jgi:hypothetical protein
MFSSSSSILRKEYTPTGLLSLPNHWNLVNVAAPVDLGALVKLATAFTVQTSDSKNTTSLLLTQKYLA